MTLNQILNQTIYRPWWTFIDSFWPTISYSPYSSLSPFYWPLSTHCRPFAFTSMLAESIWGHSVPHSHPTACGFLNPSSHYLAVSWIHCTPSSCLCCHFKYSSPHSSPANFRCPKCFQLQSSHDVGQDGGRFVWFSGSSIHACDIEPGHVRI
jgi:hypothetical protein